MNEKVSPNRDMPPPPSSGLNEILSLFQQIEDKYVSGKKGENEDSDENVVKTSSAQKREDGEFFKQSTDSIYALRMQEVLAKYSQPDKKKIGNQKKKGTSTQNLSSIPYPERLFTRHASGINLPSAKSKLDKTRQSQPTFSQEIDFHKNKSPEKTPVLEAKSKNKSPSLKREKISFFAKKKSTPAVAVVKNANIKSPVAKNFVKIFKPVEHNVKVVKVRENLLSISKSNHQDHLNSSFTSQKRLKSGTSKDGVHHRIGSSPRLHTNGGNLSSLDRNFKQNLLSPNYPRDGSNSRNRQRVKVFFKSEQQKIGDQASRKTSSGNSKLRPKEIFSANSSLNNISNLQIINSNIYFPVVDSKNPTSLNTYISVEKKEDSGRSDNHRSSTLSDVFKKTNKKRLDSLSKQIHNSSPKQSPHPSKKSVTSRIMDDSLPDNRGSFTAEKKSIPRPESEGLSPYPSESGGTYHLYKPKEVWPQSSKYAYLDLNKQNLMTDPFLKQNKRPPVNKRKDDSKSQKRDISSFNQGLNLTLFEQEDSLTEFTLLEDIISKEEADSNSKTQEEQPDPQEKFSPSFNSLKKLKYIKDDIEIDKKKIEKSNLLFDNTHSITNTEDTPKKNRQSHKEILENSEGKRKHMSMDMSMCLPILAPKALKYYMRSIQLGLLNEEDHSRREFVDHLKHTIQSMNYVIGVEAPHEDDILTRSVYLPPLPRKGKQI